MPTDIKTLYKHRIQSLIRRYDYVHFVPTSRRPVTSAAGRVLLSLYDSLLWDGFADDPVAPGCNVFPADVLENYCLEGNDQTALLNFN